jgi:formamidopyrimidine-DNA glycosylase
VYPEALPELPEVEAVRRLLEPHLASARIDRVELRRANLRTPFPPNFEARLTGQIVVSLLRRAKYLLAPLSSGDTLVMHLGMSGSFRVEGEAGVRAEGDRDVFGPDPHDHVVFHLDSGDVITFNDPRRFGLMDLLSEAQLAAHPVLSRLGREPLSGDFDAASLARACKGKKVALKVALLDQRVAAGIGNIYACEALHLARLSPFRQARTIATSAGGPRETAFRLADAIKRVLGRAVDAETRSARSSRFRVYDRAGEPCPRRGCGGTIRQRTQAGRTTFYCPRCQR